MTRIMRDWDKPPPTGARHRPLGVGGYDRIGEDSIASQPNPLAATDCGEVRTLILKTSVYSGSKYPAASAPEGQIKKSCDALVSKLELSPTLVIP